MRDRESIQRWNEDIIAEFRANQGKVGDEFEGAPMLLLHTVGARSGLARISPMMYLPDGERMIVIASKWGSPGHPDWYHNLKAHPDITVEVGTETVAVTAVELERRGSACSTSRPVATRGSNSSRTAPNG